MFSYCNNDIIYNKAIGDALQYADKSIIKINKVV